jgi:hypothetical protein
MSRRCPGMDKLHSLRQWLRIQRRTSVSGAHIVFRRLCAWAEVEKARIYSAAFLQTKMSIRLTLAEVDVYRGRITRIPAISNVAPQLQWNLALSLVA